MNVHSGGWPDSDVSELKKLQLKEGY